MALKINTKAPDFSLPSTEGKEFILSKDGAGKPLILYFYPKDFTRKCTAEACEFRDQFEVFRKMDILIYGVSTDSIETHHKFREHHNLPFHLLSDRKGKVSALYKAKLPFVNVANRVTYLIDKDHIVKEVYKELFGAESHIEAMVKQLKS